MCSRSSRTTPAWSRRSARDCGYPLAVQHPVVVMRCAPLAGNDVDGLVEHIVASDRRSKRYVDPSSRSAAVPVLRSLADVRMKRSRDFAALERHSIGRVFSGSPSAHEVQCMLAKRQMTSCPGRLLRRIASVETPSVAAILVSRTGLFDRPCIVSMDITASRREM